MFTYSLYMCSHATVHTRLHVHMSDLEPSQVSFWGPSSLCRAVSLEYLPRKMIWDSKVQSIA